MSEVIQDRIQGWAPGLTPDWPHWAAIASEAFRRAAGSRTISGAAMQVLERWNQELVPAASEPAFRHAGH